MITNIGLWSYLIVFITIYQKIYIYCKRCNVYKLNCTFQCIYYTSTINPKLFTTLSNWFITKKRGFICKYVINYLNSNFHDYLSSIYNFFCVIYSFDKISFSFNIIDYRLFGKSMKKIEKRKLTQFHNKKRKGKKHDLILWNHPFCI